MRRIGRSRAAGLLLAILLLAAVGGASDLDALFFHTGRAPGAATGPHYEPAGTPHHADHCLLSFRIGSGRRPGPRATAIRVQAFVEPPDSRRPAAVPHRFWPGLHQDLRAPPLASA